MYEVRAPPSAATPPHQASSPAASLQKAPCLGGHGRHIPSILGMGCCSLSGAGLPAPPSVPKAKVLGPQGLALLLAPSPMRLAHARTTRDDCGETIQIQRTEGALCGEVISCGETLQRRPDSSPRPEGSANGTRLTSMLLAGRTTRPPRIIHTYMRTYIYAHFAWLPCHVSVGP